MQPTPPSVPEDAVDTLSTRKAGDCDQDCVQWDEHTQEKECFDAAAPCEAGQPSLNSLMRSGEEGAEQAHPLLHLSLLLVLLLAGCVCMLMEPAAVVEFLRPDTCSVDVGNLLHAASASALFVFTLSPEASLPPT